MKRSMKRVRVALRIVMLLAAAPMAHAADSVITLDDAGVSVTVADTADACADQLETLNGATFDGPWCGTPTLVVLAYFSARHLGTDVLVWWETASEVDHEGFHLWRSEAEAGEYARIT